MQKILENIALLDTMRVCKENNIDTSGTYLIKYPRVFTYALCYTNHNAPLETTPLVTITYYKNKTTLIIINK